MAPFFVGKLQVADKNLPQTDGNHVTKITNINYVTSINITEEIRSLKSSMVAKHRLLKDHLSILSRWVCQTEKWKRENGKLKAETQAAPRLTREQRHAQMETLTLTGSLESQTAFPCSCCHFWQLPLCSWLESRKAPKSPNFSIKCCWERLDSTALYFTHNGFTFIK